MITATRLFVLAMFGVAIVSCDQMSTTETTQPPKTTIKKENTTATQKADVIQAPVVGPPKHGAPVTFADMVERTRPAVVNIYTRKAIKTNRYVVKPNNRLVPEKRLTESLGSGFIIDPNGLALTNYHVIEKATDIQVRLLDERLFPAKVIGVDPKTDVALLQIENANDLPSLKMGDSEKLRVGDWVVAIGNPLGLTSTVTAGIASAVGRKSLPMGGELRFQDFIQTDASINPGNSGGPLFDLAGNVIGINAAINPQGQGLGFAIPINMVKEILPRLKEGGKLKRSWLGVYVDDVPNGLRDKIAIPKDEGVLVRKVVKGGPAQTAGLKPGDIIVALGGSSVKNPDGLAWLAGNIGIGTDTKLAVQRGDDRFDLDIKMGVQPD